MVINVTLLTMYFIGSDYIYREMKNISYIIVDTDMKCISALQHQYDPGPKFYSIIGDAYVT